MVSILPNVVCSTRAFGASFSVRQKGTKLIIMHTKLQNCCGKNLRIHYQKRETVIRKSLPTTLQIEPSALLCGAHRSTLLRATLRFATRFPLGRQAGAGLRRAQRGCLLAGRRGGRLSATAAGFFSRRSAANPPVKRS